MKINIFKKFLIILFIMFCPQLLNAQRDKTRGNKINVKDTATWEIVYLHRAIDPTRNDTEMSYEVLSVGNKYLYYGCYGQFQYDSITRAKYQWLQDLPEEEWSNFRRSFKMKYDHMLIDLQHSNIDYRGKIFINYYRYQEPLPEFEWTLHDETITVLGHTCHKATATWRGRNWTAWYSVIPLSAGPWKFNGLPGLILRLEDDTWDHYFEAMKTMNVEYPFGNRKHEIVSKTTREKYNYELKDYKDNFGKRLVESGVVTFLGDEKEQTKMKRMKRSYSPIELE